MNNQEEQMTFFRVSKFLNKPKTMLWMTQDEIMPAAIFLVFGLITRNIALGIGLGLIWVFLIKIVKRKHKPNVILSYFYWFLDDRVGQSFFKNTLPAAKRFWLR